MILVMKKIIYLLSVVFWTTTLSGWEISRQCGFPVNFYSLDTVGNHVWAVGSSGGVAHSSDNGETYEFVNTPAFDLENDIYRDLNCVDFINENIGLIGGYDGLLIKTENGGVSWTEITSYSDQVSAESIKSICMISQNKWLSVNFDGKISETNDSGNNWTVLYDAGTQLTDITAADSVYIAVGIASDDVAENLFKSEDGGVTWTSHNLDPENDLDLYVAEIYDGHAYIGGENGTIIHSTDFFANYNIVSSAGSEDCKYRDILLTDDLCYAAGWDGKLLGFSFGSEDYISIQNNYMQKFEGIDFNGNGELVGCGWYGNILKSIDGGNFWTEQSVPYNALYSGDYGDEETWYFVGYYSYLIKTSDRGNSFEVLPVSDLNEKFTAVKFLDKDTGFVSGKTGGKIYKTSDGGQSWSVSTVEGISSSKYFYHFFFVNDSVGVAMGPGNKFAKTTDAGETWTLCSGENIGGSERLYKSFWFDENNALAVSKSGKVFKTSDGGSVWEMFTAGDSKIYDIHFKDQDHGVLVNKDGEIYYTTSGGLTAESWIQAEEETSEEIRGVTSDLDGNFFVAGYSSAPNNCGTENVIMKSTDNGATWTSETLPELTFNKNRALGIFCAEGNIISYGSNNVIYRNLADICATPVINPPGNDFFNVAEVYLNCQTPDAEIFYTLDGSDPDASSILYESPFEITDTVTVKAIAYAEGFLPSDIAEETYNIIKLSKPLNMNANFSDPVLTVAWDAPEIGTVNQYEIFRNGEFLASVTSTSYQDTTYSYGNNYDYFTRAVNDMGYTVSDTVSVTTDEVTANAGNLVIQAEGNNVTLTWEMLRYGNVGSNYRDRLLTGFKIFRNSQNIAQTENDVLTYLDADLPNGTYSYYAVPVFETGKGGATETEEIEINIYDNENYPVFETRPLGSRPNPFVIENSSRDSGTEILFELAEKQKTEITVYNVKGQVVKNFAPEIYEKGKNGVFWNGKDNQNKLQSSGIYFYRIKTKEKLFIRKMLLMK
ncbi:MAG: hypothetical protein CSB55_07005 [Candidatus Cloacimonadota bacterium]|nr:MAG: hypothetical protein CSB55_07005 [Candidatus Cloacimonadota bacterium]